MSSPHNNETNYLYWKDEILQVMYWLHGEGLDKQVNTNQLQSFLNTKMSTIERHLNQLVIDGFLKKQQEHYVLTEMGIKEGGRYFAEAFDGMQKAGHGECGPDCEYCYGPDGTKLDNCVHDCGSH